MKNQSRHSGLPVWIFLVMQLVIVIHNTTPAQDMFYRTRDSLRNALGNSKSTANKITTLTNLSSLYIARNSDSSLLYGNHALKLAEEIQDGRLIVDAHNIIGSNYASIGEYPEALRHYLLAYDKAREMQNDSLLAGSANNLGYLYLNLNEINNAKKYLEISVQLYTKINDQAGLALNYGNLGIVYSNFKEFEKSNEYYHKAIEIDRRMGNLASVARHLVNISYNSLEAERLCDAFQQAYEALGIGESLHDAFTEAISASTISEYYYYLGIDSIRQVAGCEYTIGTKTSFLAKSLEFSLRSYSLFKDIQDVHSVSENSSLLALIYEKLGDYKTALSYQKEASLLKDSIFAGDNRFKINKLEKEHAVRDANHQLRIKELELENSNARIVYQIIISFLVIGSVSLLAIFFYRGRKKLLLVNKELDTKNEELERLYNAQNKFYSIIAHDLRSPFQGFLGLTELLATESEELSRVEISRLSSNLNASAKNLYRLLMNLFEWVQLQSKSLHFNPESISLQKLFFETVTLVNDRSQQKEIQLYNQLTEQIDVFADPHMLKSVLLNLMSNAIKFTDRGGIVKLNATREKDAVIVTVSDTGKGIQKDELQKLFVPGEVVKTMGTEGEQSTGMGLILCKEFIERNGGNIWAESEPGKGSTFYFSLPLHLEERTDT